MKNMEKFTSTRFLKPPIFNGKRLRKIWWQPGLLALLLLCLLAQPAQATHIAGARITYTCADAATQTYNLKLELYRDCEGITFGNTVDITISSVSCGNSFVVQLSNPTIVEVSQLCPTATSSCANPPGPNEGFERVTFEGSVVLPMQCSDWVFSWESGDRNNAITTLVNPGSTTAYIEATLDNILGCNSSVQFSQDPVFFVCNGIPSSTNLGAVDPDGDVLRYSLVDARANATTTVTYAPGFSGTNPIATTGGYNINTVTGTQTYTPTPGALEQGPVSILIEELRGGEVIGSTIAEANLVVLDCDNVAPVFDEPTNLTNVTYDPVNCVFTTGCPNEDFVFTIPVSDANLGDVVDLSAISELIPDALLTLDLISGNPAMLVAEVLNPSLLSKGSYILTISANDNACPIPAISMKNYTLVIDDIVPPVYSACPVDATVTLDPGACDLIYNYNVTVGDNCGTIASLLPAPGTLPTGSTLEPGNYFFSYTATDPCGNFAICSWSLTINEFPNPTHSLACNDNVQISLDENCEAVVGADDVLEGGPYGCYDDYIVDLFYDPDLTQPVPTSPMLTENEVGMMIWFMVTEPEIGNTCWGKLTVEDKLIPELNCSTYQLPCSFGIRPIFTDLPFLPSPPRFPFSIPHPSGLQLTPDPNAPGADLDYTGPWTVEGFDPCGSATLYYNDIDLLNDPCGTEYNRIVKRTWVITDQSGNSSSCMDTIYLLPPEQLNIVCPPDWTGLDGANPTLKCEDRKDPNNTDICGPSPLGWNTLPPGHPYAGHPSPYDEYYSGCTNKVKWHGTGTPSINACSGVNMTFSDTRINICPTGPSDGCYKIIRDWVILDWCTGAIMECRQIIKVEDDEAPEISHIEDETISTDVWRCEADWILPVPWLDDNCDSEPLSYTVSSTGGLLQYINGHWVLRDLVPGMYDVTYTASDCCGNTRDSTIKLTVIDGVPPVAVCDQHTVVSLTSSNNPNDPNLGLSKVFASSLDDGSFDSCKDQVWFKVIRMDEFDSNGNGHGGEPVKEGDHSSIACDEANGDDDLRTFPLWYRGSQSYFDDYVKVCCDDIDNGPVMVIFRVFDINPEPYTFGKKYPGLVPVGENPDNYNGVLPEFMAPGGALYGHYSDCMVEIIVQDKIPPTIVPPPHITVTCDFWFPFDPDNPEDNKEELDEIFGKVVPGPVDPDTLRKIIIRDRVCPSHPRFAEFAPPGIFGDPCYDDLYDIPWGRDGYANDNCDVRIECEVIPNLHCGKGTIQRRWTAHDNAGNWSNTVIQTITIINCKEWYVPKVCWRFTPKDVGSCDLVGVGDDDLGICNNIFDPARVGILYLRKLIEWPCDVELTQCDAPPGQAFEPDNLLVDHEEDRRPRFDADNCSLMAASYMDDVYNFVDNSCIKIFRHWTVIDWCLYEDYQSGTYFGEWQWEWTQVIKLINSNSPTFDDCNDKMVDGFGNPGDPSAEQCVGEYDMDPGYGDDCTDDEDLRVDYKLDIDNDGHYEFLGYSSNYGSYPFPNPLGLPVEEFEAEDGPDGRFLPVGTHRILWNVIDGCNNASSCEQLITVKDAKPPTPSCVGVSTIPMSVAAGGFVDVPASHFNHLSSDNCTADENLRFSFSETDVNDDTIRYTCADVANAPFDLQVWVWDEAGNNAACDVKLGLTDCSNQSMASIAGSIENEEGEMVQDVNVKLSGYMNADQITSNNGSYQFSNLPTAQNYAVSPEKDINPLNGVSTFDLVLISKHILGVESLNSPYKMIAADINRSGSITTFDIVELRKLILFINTDFTNNTSWRFVDANFLFPQSSNPFASTFPESFNVNGLNADESANFIAVKIGDVNCSAQSSNFNGSDGRSINGRVELALDEQDLQAGQNYRLAVRAKDFDALLGFQFTLNFDKQALRFEQIEPAALRNLSAANFGTQRANEGILTASWHSKQATQIADNEPLFYLHFTATRAGSLSDLLRISHDLTAAEAYQLTDGQLQLRDVSLVFEHGSNPAQAVAFQLYQNVPNPFKDMTTISFTLPAADHIQLNIYDIAGRKVYSHEGAFEQGYNEITINRAELAAEGILHYQLQSSFGKASKRMLLLR